METTVCELDEDMNVENRSGKQNGLGEKARLNTKRVQIEIINAIFVKGKEILSFELLTEQLM